MTPGSTPESRPASIMTSIPRVLAEEEASKGVMSLSPPRTPGTPRHPLANPGPVGTCVL